MTAERTGSAAWPGPAVRVAHRFAPPLRAMLRMARRQGGSLTGLLARRWHRSLQLRVIGTTLVVSVVVVAVLGIFLVQQIASGLFNSARKAAIVQTSDGLTFAQGDPAVLGPNGSSTAALLSLVTSLQSGSGLGNIYDVVVLQRKNNSGLAGFTGNSALAPSIPPGCRSRSPTSRSGAGRSPSTPRRPR